MYQIFKIVEMTLQVGLKSHFWVLDYPDTFIFNISNFCSLLFHDDYLIYPGHTKKPHSAHVNKKKKKKKQYYNVIANSEVDEEDL